MSGKVGESEKPPKQQKQQKAKEKVHRRFAGRPRCAHGAPDQFLPTIEYGERLHHACHVADFTSA